MPQVFSSITFAALAVVGFTLFGPTESRAQGPKRYPVATPHMVESPDPVIVLSLAFEEIMANRLNAGLSPAEFHKEMIRLAPFFYWNVVVRWRLCQEVGVEVPYPTKGRLSICSRRIERSKTTKARWKTLRAQFPERALSALNPEFEYREDILRLVYRSKRLLHGATEEQVHCEIFFRDVEYEKLMIAQEFDTKKCDRPF